VDNELEVIRDEMEQTRASLADKLGALEEQVRETVSGATEAVSSTVEGVKDVVSTVSDTVDSVKEQFSLSKQFDELRARTPGTHAQHAAGGLSSRDCVPGRRAPRPSEYDVSCTLGNPRCPRFEAAQ
jgi:hypothetical protein